MRKVFIVAHGETPIDREGRVHGHLDPSLTHKGVMTASAIARQLKSKNIEKIYSSPRWRALQTANIIRNATGAPIEVRHELIPWDLASMSGARVGAIENLINYFSAHPDRKIPGGEAKRDVLTRYQKFVRELKKGDKPVVVSGHSQHTLGFDYALKGGDMTKVKMIGGQPGEIKEVRL